MWGAKKSHPVTAAVVRRIRFPKRIIGRSSYMKALLNAIRNDGQTIELTDVPEDFLNEMLVVGMPHLPGFKITSIRPAGSWREMSFAEIAACAYCGKENATAGTCGFCGGPRIYFDYLTTTR
jgi:hypothetical protein